MNKDRKSIGPRPQEIDLGPTLAHGLRATPSRLASIAEAKTRPVHTGGRVSTKQRVGRKSGSVIGNTKNPEKITSKV